MIDHASFILANLDTRLDSHFITARCLEAIINADDPATELAERLAAVKAHSLDAFRYAAEVLSEVAAAA